jgi:cysteine synthase B
MASAIKLAKTLEKGLIVTIVCDRGDRYLSSNLFEKKNKSKNTSPVKKN